MLFKKSPHKGAFLRLARGLWAQAEDAQGLGCRGLNSAPKRLRSALDLSTAIALSVPAHKLGGASFHRRLCSQAPGKEPGFLLLFALGGAPADSAFSFERGCSPCLPLQPPYYVNFHNRKKVDSRI